MHAVATANRKVLAASILIASFVFSFAIARVHAAASDSSIHLKKDPGSGLFTLTVKDPDGIQEFSLAPAGKSSYGGGLSDCKQSFSSNNVNLADPGDFTPVMPAYVIDCENNTTELEILPPVNGIAKSVALKKEVLPPPPPPPPPTEEKKVGPLSAEDVRYPVPELGSCQDEAECRSYCDNANHAKACFTFAKKYNLISEEEAKEAADKFLSVRNGPGGCNSGPSCEEYCNDVDRLPECIKFAEDTGYYSPEQLAEARKFQGLVQAGTQFPGGCKNRNDCEIYCSDSSHMKECLDFAEESGFMPKEEIDEARKFMALMQKGESPGGCTSKEQCEKFCFEENHVEECIAFAEKAGVMTAEEAAMARKVGGKGPGDCHSKKQCDAYCQGNSDACFKWAQEKGLVSEADLEQMRAGMAQFRENLDKMPPEAVACMKDAAGEENFNKMIAGEPVFDRGLEEKMKSCFGQVTAKFGQQLSQLPPEAAECIKNAVGEEGLKKLQSGEQGDLDFQSLQGCFEQLQQSFGGGGNFGAGGFSGPGGCKNTDECVAYCTANPEECKGFGPPGGGPQGGGGFEGAGQEVLSCSPKGTAAAFVCAKSGITYFNSCTAEQHSEEIDHEGVCKGQVPCADVADPVCGNDGHTWVAACHAIKEGGGVKHVGVCTGEDGGERRGIRGAPGAFPGTIPSGAKYVGPGDCKTPQECIEYCKAEEHRDECADFRTTAEPPGGSQGFGPGNTSSPEAGYQYCLQHPDECNAFITPGNEEAKCAPGKEIAFDSSNKRYCSPTSCPEGKEFKQDQLGRRYCPTAGSGPAAPPAGLTPEQIQQQATQQQIQQQYQQSQPPPSYSGPGGCTSSAECTAYCTQHYQDPACQQFAPPSGPQPGGFLYLPSPHARLNPPSLLGFFGEVFTELLR